MKKRLIAFCLFIALVAAQGVQAENFAGYTAMEALETAFGTASATNSPF